MVVNKLVATIVSSREKGMERRGSNEELTTSSQKVTTDKQKIRMSFNSKDSKRYFFTKNEECMKDNDTHIEAADNKSAAAAKGMRCKKGQ